MPAFESRFDGFWTDKADWRKRLVQLRLSHKINEREEAQLRQFIEEGYVFLPEAISPNLANALKKEISSIHQHSDCFIVRSNRNAYSYATEEAARDPKFRLIDIHVNSVLAQQALFSPVIRQFLKLVFQEDLLAFQSLTFNYGSQQEIHQDGAYVVVSDPLKFAASWIALEDVQEGSGELIFYPKSHRLPDYLFSSKYKSWNPKRDGPEQAIAFRAHLRASIADRKLEQTVFLPRKGDALVWAADLVHGGSKITIDTTRLSLVTHYCPLSVSPNYRRFSGTFQELQVQKGCHISARHYDLRQRLGTRLSIGLTELLPAKPSTLLKPSFMGKYDV